MHDPEAVLREIESRINLQSEGDTGSPVDWTRYFVPLERVFFQEGVDGAEDCKQALEKLGVDCEVKTSKEMSSLDKFVLVMPRADKSL